MDRGIAELLVEAATVVAGDPFTELSSEGVEALAAFAQKMAWWMGMATPVNLKDGVKIWKGSRELRDWLTRHVNKPVPLYRGRNVDAADLPAVGDKIGRHTIQNWSRDRKVAEKFAGFGMTGTKHNAGYLLTVTPRPKNIVVDLDALSALAGRHRESFAAVLQSSGRMVKDAIEMFSGEQYEAEVVTSGRLQGTVIRAEVL